MQLKTFPVFLAFLAMGFADAVGPFVSLAQEKYTLSNFVASLIPFAGFIMFGILSVPVGIFQDRTGKKTTLIVGLAVALAGLVVALFVAAFGLESFPMFLLTVMSLGASAAILQVAGNPIMRDVSAEGKYSRNLSLAQFVKAIGSLSGPVIPVIAARMGYSWTVIFPLYGLAILITIVSVVPLRVEEKRQADSQPATFASCLALLSNGYVAMMVLAIFLYVGAEVSVSAGIPLFLKEQYQIDVGKLGMLGTGVFFLSLTVGRFLGSVVLNWLSPRVFFLLTCAASLLGLAGMYVPNGGVAVASFVVVGLGFANIFPLVFSIAVDRMPQHTNALSGLMVTAIAGGAILPPLMGKVADQTSVLTSFLVPIAALAYIAWVAVQNRKPVAV